jgi:hypothetical protein
VGKRTESHWSANQRGNYWSSYDGYDLDGDGIGDVPMKIQNVFHFLEGQNANVRLYLYSPASQALAVAAKAFPIININQEADTYPLMRAVDFRGMPAVEMMARLGASSSAPKRAQSWLALPIVGIAVYLLLRLRQGKRLKQLLGGFVLWSHN